MVSEVPHLFIIIDIVPEHAPVEPYESSPQPWLESENVIHVSRYPRRLSCIDPTITFTSHSPIHAQSWFTVFTNDSTVHTESPLLAATHVLNPGVFLHSTVLVPSFWRNIVESHGDCFRTPLGIFHLMMWSQIPHATRFPTKSPRVMIVSSCFPLPTLSGIRGNFRCGETQRPYLPSIWDIIGPQGIDRIIRG